MIVPYSQTGASMCAYMYIFNFYSFCRQILAIVFLPLLSRELREFVQYWNSHKLRKNRTAECPQAIPDDLYDMPEHYNGSNCLQSIDGALWINAMNDAHPAPAMFSDEMYLNCHELVEEQFNIDLERQVTNSNAIEIYKYLVNNIV